MSESCLARDWAMANCRQARWMTARCEIASQKLKPVAEGVPLAGEGMDHDINRRHGETPGSRCRRPALHGQRGGNPESLMSTECPRTKAKSRA